MNNTLSEKFDSEEFYNLMQAYRHTPIREQERVLEIFESIKDYIKHAVAMEMMRVTK